MKKLLKLPETMTSKQHDALAIAVAALRESKADFCLIGGIAVGVYGYERATKDIDFLVSADDQNTVGGNPLGGNARGTTATIAGVVVDILFPKEDEPFLEDALSMALPVEGIHVLPLEALIYMKLRAGRNRDQNDIRELIQRGRINLKTVREFLKEHSSDLLDDFESLYSEAVAEG